MTLYAKFDSSGDLLSFPYDLEVLRTDHPEVSFPEKITYTIAKRFGVVTVDCDNIDYDPLVENITYSRPSRTYHSIELSEITDENGEFYPDYSEEDVGRLIDTGRYSTIAQKIKLPVEVAEYNVRSQRDMLLSESDWVSIRSIDKGQPIDGVWAEYRQSLRDLTDQQGFPYSVTWPVRP